MKANDREIAAALDAADPKVRLFVLYGPDDAGSRALAARLERAMGADAERIDLDGATLKDDPARLADEAAAISLFGSKRWLRVTGGDECLAAVEALLEGPAGDPAVLIAGALKGTSALIKFALASKAVLAFQSYKPEGQRAGDIVIAAGRARGLRLDSRLAARIASGTTNDRAVIDREVEKLALYLDAAPDRPREAGHDDYEAIGADLGEADHGLIVDAAFDGNPARLAAELALAGDGAAIPLLRAFGRRMLLLARLRAAVERGKPPGAVMAAEGGRIFYKERDAIGRQLARWRPDRLATVARRLGAAEQAVKRPGNAGDVLVAAELVAIARVGASLR